MDLHRLADLIKTYSPAHFRDICAALTSLSDEMEYTKAALSADLISAQNQDDFSRAREILDAQEGLSQRITDIRNLLAEYDVGEAAEEPDEIQPGDEANPESGERIDYSLYDMDDTVAYNIEDTSVTFKRPAAFTFNGKWYQATKWKSMLVKICDLLYKQDPEIIKNMANETRRPGKKRVKMSQNKVDINSPQQIAGSNLWIETNRSADEIRNWILILLERYDMPAESVKVYFRRDYTALHVGDGEGN